jgi:hypothetical protein
VYLGALYAFFNEILIYQKNITIMYQFNQFPITHQIYNNTLEFP